MSSPKKLLLVLLLGVFSLFSTVGTPALAAKPHKVKVRLTWMGIANWLFEVGKTRIVMDGAITRFGPGRDNFFGPGNGLEFTFEPVTIDVEGVQQVIDALGLKKKGKKKKQTVDFILTGHSHLDHAYDTGIWNLETGAHIIGSQSTCFTSIATGVDPNDCTVVNGGESLDLGSGVTVHVFRLHHSGGSLTGPCQNPIELSGPPTPTFDPVTGVIQFRAGIEEDFVNGGGARGYIFTVDNGRRGPISWVFIDSTSRVACFDLPVIVDGVDFGVPRANMIAAMAAAGLDSVDLLIQNGSTSFSMLSVPILNPRAFLPNHQGSFTEPFLLGNTRAPFSSPALEDFLDSRGIELVIPVQFMDKWKLDAKGIKAKKNRRVKKKLGFN